MVEMLEVCMGLYMTQFLCVVVVMVIIGAIDDKDFNKISK